MGLYFLIDYVKFFPKTASVNNKDPKSKKASLIPERKNMSKQQDVAKDLNKIMKECKECQIL